MKYFFVADVHGEYDKMVAALDAAGFNPKVDTIVSLGDAIDRGPKSLEVVKYLLSCPNRIIIMGNHEGRFKEIMLGKSANKYDVHNGVNETLSSFCGGARFYGVSGISAGVVAFKTDDRYKDNYHMFSRYLAESHYAAEWGDLIATHGWLPNVAGSVYPNWRDAGRDVWYDATWANTNMCVAQVDRLEKKLVVGHWHTAKVRRLFGDKSNSDLIFSTDKLIAIDGCANAPNGVVNVLVCELEDEPIFY